MMFFDWSIFSYHNIFAAFTRLRLPVSEKCASCDYCAAIFRAHEPAPFYSRPYQCVSSGNWSDVMFLGFRVINPHCCSKFCSRRGGGGVLFWNPARIWAKIDPKNIKFPKSPFMRYWRYVNYELNDLSDTSMVYILSSSPLNNAI